MGRLLAVNKLSATLALILISILGSHVYAASGITYQGRLLKPDGTPVLATNVQFRLEIRTPGAEDCLMFEELQSADLSTTNGAFAISLNDGNGVRQDSNAWGLFEALSNRKAFGFSGGDCTGVTSYTPVATDNRKFRVYFNDGSFTGWEPLPIQTINYIPMAVESYAVGGYPASSLLRVENAGNLGTASPITNAQLTELLALLGGTTTQYSRRNQLNGSTLPTIGTGQSVRWTGSAWEAYTPPTNASLPTCTAGQVLTSDGSALSCVAGGSAGAIDGDDITSGTIGGTTAWNTSGNITTTGNITGTNVSSTTNTTRNLRIYETTNTNYVQIQAPAGLTPNYTLTLPVDDGTSGQVLSTNGSGVLSWWTPASSNVNLSQIHSTVNSMNPVFPSVACTTAETLRYDSLTDTYQCSAVTVGAASGALLIGGNTTGATVVAGTNDAQSFQIETNGQPRLTVNNSGDIGIGTEVPGARLHIFSESMAGLNLDSVTASQESQINFRRAQGTAGTMTGVLNGERLGNIVFSGYTGSFYTFGARIGAVASENWTGTGRGTDLIFTTKDLGTNSSSVKLRILASGGLRVAPTALTPTPATGDLFIDSADGNKLKWYDGSAWQSAGGASGGSGDILNGGNTGAVTVGTNDGTALTLETNNTPRVTVLSSGGVGIGTTNPGTDLLQLSQDNADTKLRVSNTSSSTARYPGITVQNFNSGQGGYGVLNLVNGNGTAAAPAATASGDVLGRVRFYGTNSAGGPQTGAWISSTAAENVATGAAGSNLQFATSPVGTSNPVNRITITSAGNVGVGTTNPGRLLHVDGPIRLTASALPTGATGDIAIDSGDGNKLKWYNGSAWQTVGTSSSTGDILNGGNTGAVTVGTNDATALTLETDNSPRVTVLSDGRVGIGTTTPGNKLSVYGGSFGISRTSPAAADLGVIGYPDQTIGLTIKNTSTTDPITFQTNSSELMRLRADRTVSIGQATGSTARLEIKGQTSDGTSASLNVMDSSDSSKFYVRNDGNVGIGTTAPSRLLHVNSGIRLQPSALPGTGGAGDLFVDSGDSNKLKWHDGTAWRSIATSGTAAGSALLDGGNATGATVTVGTTDGQSLGLRTNGTNKVTILSGGNVGIGTGSPGTLFHTYGTNATGPSDVTVENNAAGTAARSRIVVKADSATNNLQISQLSSTFTTSGASRPHASVIDSTGSGGLSIASSDASGLIRFYTAGTAVANERMRIDSSGNVGIGTSNPSGTLHVVGGTAASGNGTSINISAQSGVSGSTSNGGSINITTGGGYISSGYSDANYGSLNFKSGGETHTVNAPFAAGPYYNFGTVTNGMYHTSGTPIFMNIAPTIIQSATAGYTLLKVDANETGSGSGARLLANFAHGGTSRFAVTAGGNVGIGTTTPGRLLHVNGPMRLEAAGLPLTPGIGDIAIDSADGNKMKWYNGLSWQTAGSSGGGSGDILNGGNNGAVRIGSNDNILNLETNNNIRMTVNAVGDVGIGTTNPSHLLDLYGETFEPSLHIQSNDTGSAGYYPGVNSVAYTGTTATYPILGLYRSRGVNTAPVAIQAGDAIGTIEARGHNGSGFQWGANIAFIAAENFSGSSHATNISFRTVDAGSTLSSQKMIISSSGIGIGTDSPGRLLHVNGPMRVTAAALPLTPGIGDIAIDSGDGNKMKWYDGLAWQTAGSSGGGGAVSGSNGQIQFNNSGAFGAEAGLAWDATNKRFTVSSSTSTVSAIRLINSAATGTTSPLQITQGNLANGSEVSMSIGKSLTTGNAGFVGYSPNATAANNQLQLGHYGQTASMVIQQNGNVGIGTTTPTADLMVFGNTATDRNIRLENRHAGNASYLTLDAQSYYSSANFAGTNGTTPAWWSTGLYNSPNFRIIDQRVDTIPFQIEPSAPTGSMHIRSTGNVGIGTSTPGTTLHVLSPNANGITVERAALINSGIEYKNTGGSMYAGIATNLNFAVGSASNLNSGSFQITPAGNVGIGTNNPAYPLDVVGSMRVSKTTTGLTYLDVINTSDSASNDGANVRIVSRNVAGTGLAIVDLVKYKSGSFNISNNETDPAAATVFTLGASERMRISSSGNVGIGTNSPTQKLHVSGTVLADAYTYTSDRRLKTNIETTEGLNTVLKLRGVDFDWRKSGQHDTGFIAQEVEEVVPHLVVTNSDGVKSVKYGNLIGPIVEAIKELFAKSQNVEREIASLKEQNKQLQKKNQELEQRLQRIEQRLGQ